MFLFSIQFFKKKIKYNFSTIAFPKINSNKVKKYNVLVEYVTEEILKFHSMKYIVYSKSESLFELFIIDMVTKNISLYPAFIQKL